MKSESLKIKKSKVKKMKSESWNMKTDEKKIEIKNENKFLMQVKKFWKFYKIFKMITEVPLWIP